MNKTLVIIGASGHGKVVADAAQKLSYGNHICFLDDDESLSECGGFPVVGKSCEAGSYIEKADIFVAVGNAEIRQRMQEQLHKIGAVVPVVCHPKAVIGRGVELGEGTVVLAGAVINPGSIIGKGCIINTCASIDHDCQVADYVHISVGAHLAGTVQIGERTWIGVGAAVSNNVVIGGDCMIGAGAVVVKNIKKPGVYIGIPAKELHKRSSGNILGGGNPTQFIEKDFAARSKENMEEATAAASLFERRHAA